MARESNSVETYMPLVIEKYLGDTSHLTTVQHGAYFLLLVAYWRRGGPLPADDARLASIAKMTPKEWRLHRYVIAEFFEERDGTWWQKRAEAELSRARNKSEAARKSAGARWHSDGNANGMRSHNESICERNAPPSTTSVEANASTRESAPKPATSSRLPSDWAPTAEHLEFAAGEGFEPDQIERIAAKFRDYWTAKAGAGGRKVDWLAAWRNWVRSDKDNGGKSRQHGAGSGSSRQQAALKNRRAGIAAGLEDLEGRELPQ